MVAPKCGNCGYYGVHIEATMEWDFDTQEWLVGNVTGFSTCGKCGDDYGYEMVETDKASYEANLEDSEYDS